MAGYSVYVQREDGGFKHEIDVSNPNVTLRGAPGSSARVIVVAFDSKRAYGPNSPTSPVFVFPNPSSSYTPAAASEVNGSSGVAAAAGGGGSIGSDPVDDPAPSSSPSPTPSPAPALPGTLVWQSGDGFRLTDTELVTARVFARPYDGAQLAGVADFDADGHGDLLWVGADAQLGYTSGGALRNDGDPVPLVDLGALAADERAIGAGDFDGDGDGDVLVTAGDAVRARLSGAPAQSELGTASQAVLAGIADFDGNGSEDIAWRASTSELVLWMMNGGSLSATVEVALESGYQPLGAGDFDGDGAAELVLRGPDGNGYGVHPLAAQPQLEATDLDNVMFWNAVGVADLDQDGAEELVLGMAAAIRIAGLPGDQMLYSEDASPWQLVALLP